MLVTVLTWFKDVAAHLGASLRNYERVSGGDISEAYRIELSDGRTVFVKHKADAPSGMFAAEAAGLAFLKQARSELIIPAPLYWSESSLVLENLTPSASDQSEALGRALAQLHTPVTQAPGAAFDGFIGTLPQKNTPLDLRPTTLDWPSFFVQRRLLPQLEMQAARHLISRRLRGELETLLSNLGRFFPADIQICPLHGDLWSGNHMFTQSGPAIFDPAPYYGHHEVDLAMMDLFGGYSQRCYQSYHEMIPQQPGDKERLALYQLYPLLVHVNLFGGGYVNSVEGIVRRLS